MQADYHLHLTFPHPTSPKAANTVASRELPFSLMKLPHLIAFPFSYKTVEKWATVLSPWHVGGRCKGCQASTTHPLEAHPSISKRRLLVRVGAMLGEMPQPQPTPVFLELCGANYKSNKAKTTSVLCTIVSRAEQAQMRSLTEFIQARGRG